MVTHNLLPQAAQSCTQYTWKLQYTSSTRRKLKYSIVVRHPIHHVDNIERNMTSRQLVKRHTRSSTYLERVGRHGCTVYADDGQNDLGIEEGDAR
jgi:hypothetical protein